MLGLGVLEKAGLSGVQRSRPTGNSADTSSPESESEYTVLAWLTDSSWRGSAASAPEGEPRSGCCGIGEDEDIWCDAGFQSFFGGSVVGFMNRSRTLGESHPADDLALLLVHSPDRLAHLN